MTGSVVITVSDCSTVLKVRTDRRVTLLASSEIQVAGVDWLTYR
jgi:hypothetical protein